MDYSRKFTERWEMLNEMYGKQALSYSYHNKTSLKQGAYIHQPRPGQYLTHTHNHITRAVATMDSCFTLIGAHQRGIAVRSMNGQTRVSKTLYC